MGLFDEKITYRYTCTECNYEYDYTATIAEHAKINSSCEKCSGHVCFKAIDYKTHASVDTKKPKTLGTLAEKNSKEREKRGESLENPNKTYDRSILKNPQRYIETGKK